MNNQNSAEFEEEKNRETLNHYCFSLEDLALARFNLTDEQIANFKLLLLTGLAEEIAKEMNDNWLISHGKDLHVVLYDKSHATKENEDKIIKYYVKNNRIPEDILYLDNETIELYSRNVSKIEEHKARLEILTENISVLIERLVVVDNLPGDKEEKEISKIEMIMNYLQEERNRIQLEDKNNSTQKNKSIL